MLRFAANLSFMFTEVPFLDRFECAARAGFQAVEFLFPYDHPAVEIGARLKAFGLDLAIFNLPPGDWDAGERGFACLPARRGELLAAIERALPYAHATGAKRLHLMAGIGDAADSTSLATYQDAVVCCAKSLDREGLDLLIEPINRRDMPGYFLNDFDLARDVIEQAGMPNIRLQYDIYHRQMMRGDVSASITSLMPIIGHIQIAAVPGRGQPESGELNWPYLFSHIANLGYHGYIGCEYRPTLETECSLKWFEPWRRA